MTELYEDYHSKKVYFEQLLYSINFAENIEDLFEISDEIEENKPDKSKNKKSQISEIKRFEPDEQTTIYVGKNNKQNDYLSTKVLKNNDLWFHTKDIHGSHGILQTNNTTPSIDVIIKCSQIIAYYSQARQSSNVPVDYTLGQYVKKPSGSKPGMVIYTHNSTINVQPNINS